ncbi:MAG: diguanylate cyclase, partial [Colwellia sp.]
MKLSLQQRIYFFTLSCSLLFGVLVISILWSTQSLNVALKRDEYAHRVENHTNILKQFITSENIYAGNYNTDNWFSLDSQFNELLRLAPRLTPPQKTIQNSIESQNKNVLRLFNAINKNKLKNASEIIKKHLKTRLMTQLEAIRSDSIQLSHLVKKDIENVIRDQIIFILSVLSLVIFILVYGAFRLNKIFRTSLNEIKSAFEKNHSGQFPKIQLSNQSQEFTSIANAFNTMNKKLSETTVSLESMKETVAEKTQVLERIAHYDILTNLPNRVLLADRISQAMLQCSRHQQSLAVVFLDLDGFKTVNDTYGHDVGDELLIALSVRMKEALREGDTLSRIGGDEFVAVLADLVNVEDCEPVLERLLLAASEPVTVGDIVVNVSASIGVTLYPQDNEDADQLIHHADQLMRHADQAMYVAKESGKNRYHYFDTAQDDAVKVQRENLEAIRRALDNQQFVLHYQPKVNMRIGKVIGFEALIRWQHPERGLLNSIEFLPAIENNPMNIEMGEWVIDTALTQISQWQAIGLHLPVSTSVNIAAVQLQQSDFTQRLTTLLTAHPDVEPRYLELEVQETRGLNDVNHIATIMNNCMALGVNFALDDFGTGYSSLTYLRRLPANI